MTTTHITAPKGAARIDEWDENGGRFVHWPDAKGLPCSLFMSARQQADGTLAQRSAYLGEIVELTDETRRRLISALSALELD